MKNALIHPFILLLTLSFLMTGCGDSLVKATADVLIDKITDDDEEQKDNVLKLLKSGNDFGIEWNKKDSQYSEVLYLDNTGEMRKVIMVGTSSRIRRYLCTFQKDTDGVAEYLCIGTGTPELGDSSNSGEITLYFKKGIEYAFLVDDGLINNILEYTGSGLSIYAP